MKAVEWIRERAREIGLLRDRKAEARALLAQDPVVRTLSLEERRRLGDSDETINYDAIVGDIVDKTQGKTAVLGTDIHGNTTAK